MTTQPTMLSLLGAMVYLGAASACVLAFLTARRHHQKSAYLIAWSLIGAVFLCLAASRFFGLEDQAEAALRIWMIAEGGYLDRAEKQGPVALIALFAIAGLAILFAYYARKKVRGRREWAVAIAVAGTVSMLGLVTLRLISLHATDQWLYGPLKLNWIADLGLSALVTGCAAYFVLIVSGRMSRAD